MPKKDNAFEVAMKQLDNYVISSGDTEPDEHIPTGHFPLDFAINYGYDPTKTDLSSIPGYDPSIPLGLPVGKIVEFFGEEGGGKSSLAYRVVGTAQKMGYTAAWIDAECSFSKPLATINGCNADDLLLVDTGVNGMTAEQVLEMISIFATCDKIPQVKRNGKKVMMDKPKIIVIDSLASLVPKVVDEGTFDQQFVGTLARLLSTQMGRISQLISSNKILLIIINQLREKIGMNFGDPSTSPGGHAIKHFFSVRLRITKKKSRDADITKISDDGEEQVIGGHAYIKIEKNRFGRPVQTSLEIPIYYEQYFPNIEEVAFDTGRQLKIISVRKGVFSWNDLKQEGKTEFIRELKDQKMVSDLIREIKNVAKENKVIVPPELHLYESEGSVDEPEAERQVHGDGEGGDSPDGKGRASKGGKGKRGS
jgi:recombination protein RecA